MQTAVVHHITSVPDNRAAGCPPKFDGHGTAGGGSVDQTGLLHEIDWGSLKVIDRAGRKNERKLHKAFHIYKHKPGINRDLGVERTVWNTVH